MLNAQLKGNFDVLGPHAHSGAAGNGTSNLAGLDSATLASDSAPSTPSSGTIILWVDGEILKVKNSSGTVSIISLAGHTH
jgi:hypothetical protein